MAIYNGTQKVKMSGIAKVYVGNTLVYQNAPVLTSITLSGQTTSLNRGSAFSFGGTVTAHYDNGTTADVTANTTFSGYNMSSTGQYTVTASYTENNITQTATYTLKVVANFTVSFPRSYIYAIKVDGNAFTLTNTNISSGSDTGNVVSSLYMAYKVENSGTAPAIWTSASYRTGFTTKTKGTFTRFCIVAPGGAIGFASSYSSNQDAQITLPSGSTAGYTLVSNTQLGKAEGNDKYGKCRRVIFDYSGTGTIRLSSTSSKASAGYFQPRYAITIE